MNISDLLNDAAMLCNGVGLLLTVLVYKRPDSQTYLYNKSARPTNQKRDRAQHRLAVSGFIALGLAFLLQLTAQLIRKT